MSDLSYMNANVKSIRERINAASARVDGHSVTMVAAIKYTDAEHVNYLHRVLGVNDVGENRVQQLLERWDALDREGLRVHFIGKLQSNKVKYIIDKVVMIHSLDGESLAAEIERQAAKKGIVMDVLVEINSGREDAKSGVLPEAAEALCRAVLTLPHLHLCGFMTMGPRCESEQEYRAYFAQTVSLGNTLWKRLGLDGAPLFSMGMSESFPAAVKEGADMVRVGRRLFAGRPETNP